MKPGAGTIFAVYFLLPPPMRMWNCGSVPANGDLRWNCGRVNRSFTVSDFYPPPATKRDASGSPATKNARIPFLLEGTTIHLNYTSSELATGSELILMRFDAPAAGIWKIRVYHTLSIQGEYHMWLPVHGFISDETFFLRPDPDTTITDPGNTAAIITTAAYSHQTGGIYLHSSRGFTRTRTIKPDLAAPGVRLPLPDYQEVTGTSFAAAMTAGAAAILLSCLPIRHQPRGSTPRLPRHF